MYMKLRIARAYDFIPAAHTASSPKCSYISCVCLCVHEILFLCAVPVEISPNCSAATKNGNKTEKEFSRNVRNKSGTRIWEEGKRRHTQKKKEKKERKGEKKYTEFSEVIKPLQFNKIFPEGSIVVLSCVSHLFIKSNNKDNKKKTLFRKKKNYFISGWSVLEAQMKKKIIFGVRNIQRLQILIQ